MKSLAVYIHGKGGSAAEAERYKKFFANVVGFDYKAQTPWDAVTEFQNFFEFHRAKIIIANSLGAYFAMTALAQKNFDRAFFISPVVDMEKIITGMMKLAGVTEVELRDKKEIATDFGETLSWKYLCYARENPVRWHVPTHILYGEKDALTSQETISAFAEKIGATLTVMPAGEHWFHTPPQMKFLENWLEELTK